MRIDGLAAEVEAHVFAERLDERQHFALEALQVLEGDVKEIAAAAGGIEHAHGA